MPKSEFSSLHFKGFGLAGGPLYQTCQWAICRFIRAAGYGFALLILFGFIVGSAPVLSAPQLNTFRTIHVDSACTLVDAITAANSATATGNCLPGGIVHTEIVLPASSYIEFSTGEFSTGEFGQERSALPPVHSAITLIGNGATIARAENLDCPGQQPEENFRFLTIEPTGALTLTHITLERGCATESGGALLVRGGHLTLHRVSLGHNHAPFQGGAIHGEAQAHIQVTDSVLHHNSALRGGAVNLLEEATLSMTHSEIAENHVTAIGGGVFLLGATAHISTTTFTHNTAFQGGGIGVKPEIGVPGVLILADGVSMRHNQTSDVGAAIYMDGSQISIDQAIFQENEGRQGGAIAAVAGPVQIAHTRFLSNTATLEGGAIFGNANVEATITHSHFSGNQSAEPGTSLLLVQGNVQITHSTFSYNGPGALVRDEGNLDVSHSCIQYNHAPAVLNRAENTPIVALYNWWNAVDGPGGELLGTGDAVSAGVDAIPFADSPWPVCLPSGSDLQLSIDLATLPPWLPGTPLTGTITVMNQGPQAAADVVFEIRSEFAGWEHLQFDSGLFVAQQTNILPPIADSGAEIYQFGVDLLAPGSTSILSFTGQISTAMQAEVTGRLEADISHRGFDAESTNNFSAAILHTALPRLGFAAWLVDTPLTVEEGDTPVAIPLELDSPNPHVSTSAQVRVQWFDSADALLGSENRSLTLEPGQTSQLLLLDNLENDIAEGNRTIRLDIVSAVNAKLASATPEIGAPPQTASIQIVDNDQAGISILSQPTELTEGETGSQLVLVLSSMPLAPVIAQWLSGADCIVPASITIEPHQWKNPSTLPLFAPLDGLYTGPRNCPGLLQLSSDDPAYSLDPALELTLSILDVDLAAMDFRLSLPAQVVMGQTFSITGHMTNTGTAPITQFSIYLGGDPIAESFTPLESGHVRHIEWTDIAPHAPMPQTVVLHATAVGQVGPDTEIIAHTTASYTSRIPVVEPEPNEPPPTTPNPDTPPPLPQEPTPVEPAPVEPTPIEPTPSEPVSPDPQVPGPDSPAPEPKPDEETPGTDDPFDPPPSEPTPNEPEPVEPTPAEPNPDEPDNPSPVPVEPNEPEPNEPDPTQPDPPDPEHPPVEEPIEEPGDDEEPDEPQVPTYRIFLPGVGMG